MLITVCTIHSHPVTFRCTAENDDAQGWLCGLVEMAPLCPRIRLFALIASLNNCIMMVKVMT